MSDDMTDDGSETANGAKSPGLKALEEVKAMKEAFAAILPSVDAQDEGTVTREDGETIGGSLLLHHALRSIGETIASKVEDKAANGARIRIVRSLDQASDRFTLAHVKQSFAQLQSYAEAILTDMGPPQGPTPQPQTPVASMVDPITVGGLAALAGAAVEVMLAVTQSNISIREATLTVTRPALIAPIADRLLDKGLKPSLDELGSLSADNEVMTGLAELLTVRDKLVAAAAWVRKSRVEGDHARTIAELTEHLKALRSTLMDETDAAKRETLQAEVVRLQGERAALQQLVDVEGHKAEIADGVVAAINQHVVAITTATDAAPAPLLTAAFQAEVKSGEYVLFAESAGAGGGSLWKKTAGFDHALHQGGAAVAWVLANHSGDVVGAGVEAVLSSVNSAFDESANIEKATVKAIST